MCYSGKLAMKREALVEASKVARSLKSLEEIDGTINYVLLNYIYETSSRPLPSGRLTGTGCVKVKRRL